MKLWVTIKEILNFLCQYKENKERKEILEDIKKAKQIFLKERSRFMCNCFQKVNPKKYSVINIRNIIPEFTPTTFNINVNPDNYYTSWWPIADRESRIKAFDKLIEIYSN